jgi:hypothetical protein
MKAFIHSETKNVSENTSLMFFGTLDAEKTKLLQCYDVCTVNVDEFGNAQNNYVYCQVMIEFYI